MLYKDIKNKSTTELNDLIVELKAELFLLRFKNKTSQQEQTHKIQVVRKDVAKVLTALKEKQILGEKELINKIDKKEVKKNARKN
ncbi:50S ribosomal protein L29 [[Mycoplasma] mobile]|uniref:Large ribosomal subunit protein uL29 n=1 Tax=Mycoplasma mobile (strain ATCC 43663 / 163K / NCTC 11711) TaxID=267748 RepID=RL29_MYCM1|nr:50S ribosomal protein L29 [[Mycoplasma] mobile]Q6KI47.1 RecName: Full=Large ribosomal subunit protein uL29; AltName: Full=50S ribosomal protein L29 [Mycoplasma mobile 163K]AAT27729.1 50S ribosomal protein l29 [Mycoplasma mobile 163K]